MQQKDQEADVIWLFSRELFLLLIPTLGVDKE